MKKSSLIASAIKEKLLFECNIPDVRIESDDSVYHVTSKHYICLLRKKAMMNKKTGKYELYRLYLTDIDSLAECELYLADIYHYATIYKVPLDRCASKKLYESKEGAYYIFSTKEMKEYYVKNNSIGKALKELMEGEKVKKSTLKMTLNDAPFYQIKNGEKTVELRLLDEKRKKISVGDVIVFARRESQKETLAARVVALHCYPTFAELFATPLFQKCGWSDLSPAEAKAEMRRYYSEQEERQHGVLGIEIELIGADREKR